MEQPTAQMLNILLLDRLSLFWKLRNIYEINNSPNICNHNFTADNDFIVDFRFSRKGEWRIQLQEVVEISTLKTS